MSEQRGRAAGTAKLKEVQVITFHTTWSVSDQLPAVIFDAQHRAAASVTSTLRRSPEEIVAIQRHIVACVNFCAGIHPELPQQLTDGHFKIQLNRIDLQDPTAHMRVEAITKIICEGRENFVRDLRNGHARLDDPLPGGAL